MHLFQYERLKSYIVRTITFICLFLETMNVRVLPKIDHSGNVVRIVLGLKCISKRLIKFWLRFGKILTKL